MKKPKRSAVEEALERRSVPCGCGNATCIDAQILARALRKARKDTERLDWLLHEHRIVWPLGSCGPESRGRIDDAMKARRKT